MKKTLITLLSLLYIITLWAQPLPRTLPENVGMDSKKLLYADSAILKAINNNEIPGAVLAVVKDGKIAYLKAYGNKQIVPDAQKMENNTVFDLASVTKPIATATSAMILIERAKIRLQDRVNMYIPDFQAWQDSVTKKKKEIRIIDLLTHTSGLPPYAPVAELEKQYGSPNPDGLIKYISTCKRDFEPETKFQYSCLNFITLQRIIETATKQNLRDFAKANIFDVLGMTHTDYNPTGETFARVAPTEKQKDGTVLKGVVHDPLARVMNGGISGNAGLFSDANDLAIFVTALQNGGEYNGKRILSPLGVKALRNVPQGFELFGRTLGWDISSDYASNQGDLFSAQTYGHTGYTGTSVIIDPDNNISVILLTNRVHPDDKGEVVRLRSMVANAVAASVVGNESQLSVPQKTYSDYYYTRCQQFAQEPPITSNDIVMLGNSITEGGKDWNALLGMKNIRNRGISGDIASGALERINSIVSGQPKKLFLLIGINDISREIPNDTIVSNIEEIVKEFKAQSPKTEIYLQSILPFDQSKRGNSKRLENKERTVMEANGMIKKLAKKYHVHFINLYPLFVEKNTDILKAEYTYDGLHLNEEGYKVWAKELKKHL